MKITKARLTQIIKEELEQIAEVPRWAVKQLTAPAQEDGFGGIQSEMIKQVKVLAQLVKYDLEEKEPIGLRDKGKTHYALDDLLKLVEELAAWASGEKHGYDFKPLSSIKNELAIVMTAIDNLRDMRPAWRFAKSALERQLKRLAGVIKSKFERDSKKKPEMTGPPEDDRTADHRSGYGGY